MWRGETEQWGDHIVGKALDDRVPLAVITEVMRRVPREQRTWDVTLAATVQEEIGIIGAAALAAREQFDAAIILEIGLAGDIPQVGLDAIPSRLGDGPMLVHKDSIIHYDHALTAAHGEDGERRRHPDPARRVRLVRQRWRGVHAQRRAGGHDRLPARYTHSPFEMAHLGDIEKMVDWLAAFVTRE